MGYLADKRPMSINNILSNRSNRDITAAMKKMADGKLNLTVTPAVQIPDKLDVTVLNPVREVSVSNIGDVLKSLALLGKGLQQLSDSVEALRGSKEVSEIKFPDFPEMPDMGELAKSIKELRLQIKKIPQQTAVDAPIIEIPKSFRVDNLDELKRGFVAINDNLVKLAGVVRESQPNITLPDQDSSALIVAVDKVERAINSIKFPVPVPAVPAYFDTAGKPVSATAVSRGSVNAVSVQLVDGSGSQVTSFGGGTQYTEGDTDATITGTVSMWEDAANTLVATSGAKPFPVEIIAGAGSGGTAAADDADFTAGTTSGTPAMGVYESTPTSVTDGDLGTVGITADRRLKVSADLGATDNAVLDAIAASTAAIETAVEGTLTVTGGGGGTEYTSDAASPTDPVGATSLIVRDDALSTQETTDGDWTAMRGNSKGALWVQHDGNITADLGATDNAVLDAIAASVAAIDTDTTTLIGHVDGVEALLTTIDADTSNLSVVGGGTEAAAIRVTIANNSTGVLSIDDNGGAITVDGTITADLGATDNAVLDAIAASVAAIDTDTTTIIGHVDGIETVLGTIDADTGNIATSVALLDDTVTTLGTDTYTEATSKGITLGAVRRDADTTLVGTTNEFTPLQVDANGRLKVEAFSGEALPVTLTSTTVTGTVAVTQSGTWDEVGINDSGNSITVDNGGTFLVQENGAALTALQLMDDWDNGASDGASVSGDVAHDTADAGEPVKIGYKAVDLGATPTAVTANDRTNAYATRGGIPFFLGGAPNTLSQSLQVTDADGAQTDTAIITVSAGTAIVVTKVSVTADNANTGDVSCRIGFGTANTPAADAAGVVMFHPGIAPGSGIVEGSGAGIIGIGASDQDLRVTCEDPAGGSINIIVTYHTVLIG